ncbi:MAG: tRNA (adenosine(37)-N6)-dimethylallyltransferase MiaA [Burkholderiaceae bacterium]
MTQDKPTALFILGPTASGKTALALALAQQRPIEIISVDSALVYRGMDIGTAKPSRAEQAVCPHHLIDIIEPTEAYSAAQFAADTQRLIHEIHARGRLPVLVGGTMLYVKALLEPLTELPESDAQIRAQIDAQAADLGWPAMHAQLAQIDPITAARIEPNDAQRINRALEIFRISGKPMAQWLAEDTTTHELSFKPILTALIPEPRAVLHERINQRFVTMLNEGFLDEMRTLRARGDLHLGLPSMRCVGYRQAWEHLDGAYGYDELIEKGQAATRQLAKRQMTWIRGMPQIRVFDSAVMPQNTHQLLGQIHALIAEA